MSGTQRSPLQILVSSQSPAREFSRVRTVYGKLSPEFTTSSGVRQGCPLSPSLFNFVIDLFIESSLHVSGTCVVELFPVCPLVDIGYADVVDTRRSNPSQMRAISNKLNNWAASFGMCSTPSNCKYD